MRGMQEHIASPLQPKLDRFGIVVWFGFGDLAGKKLADRSTDGTLANILTSWDCKSVDRTEVKQISPWVY